MKKRILIFSGSGVDKESGIETFRDSNDGLWNNYKIEDVATPDGWRRDKQKVIDFYNERRKQLKNVEPNLSHLIISELEKWFDVTIVTQNITDLHELAGSSEVIHLHGEITKLRSEINPYIVQEWIGELELGQLAEDGNQLRPDVVFFGEELNLDRIEEAKRAASECDACIIIGTSMQVAPANMIPFLTPETCLLYYVDPGDRDFYLPKFREFFFYHFQEIASVGMKQVKEDLLSTFKIKD